jgi:zinc transport system ATP-binding protein
MKPNLVTIKDLTVTLGGNPILRGVNASLARNSITALIGLNGAGKSTLLRALVKEVRPDSGSIAFHCGHDHSRPAPEHVGYVPQRLRIEANLPLTVYDLFGMALQRRPLFLGATCKVRERMTHLLQRVNALNLLHKPVEKLSGGELQRVLLALAMEPHPELLLLDEPAAGIDFKEGEKFYDLIANLNRETGATILLVSHDTHVVDRMADHVLCLKDGRIACQGPPREIISEHMLEQIFGSHKGFYDHHHHHPHPGK